jgi:histidine kinase
MRLSLNTKIILSMAGMVFLTAAACCGVFLVIVNNQTRDFENRLETIVAQAPAPLPASDILDKARTILSNTDLTPDVQLQQLRTSLRGPSFDFDKVKDAAAESGWPVSGRRLDTSQTTPGFGPRPDPSTRIKDELNGNSSILTGPMFSSILIASGISVLFAIGLGFLLSRTVIRPLRALEHASEKIANGNYTLVLKPEGKDDLGRLAASFNKMSQALRQTERKRKDLVADLSHELRTPLSSIQGYTEVLRDGLVQEPNRRDDIYDHILNEVKHMGVMVNSMREWINNQQELDHLRLEAFEVEPVLHTMLDRFKPTAENKEVELRLEIDTSIPEVRADSEALSHVVSNLIDNSLRYTSAGGSITVRVSNQPKLKQVTFEVIDTGSGIPAEHLPFVFERFYRVDKSRDRNTGGTGLGLAIARDAVLAQGGDITIESEVGKGTRVIFHLLAATARIPQLVGM